MQIQTEPCLRCIVIIIFRSVTV